MRFDAGRAAGAIRCRAREGLVCGAWSVRKTQRCGAHAGSQIRAKEQEYVTFVRILTLMCRFASISAAKAAIFVTLYRGESLDHQGASAAKPLVRSGTGRFRSTPAQRDRCARRCK